MCEIDWLVRGNPSVLCVGDNDRSLCKTRTDPSGKHGPWQTARKTPALGQENLEVESVYSS